MTNKLRVLKLTLELNEKKHRIKVLEMELDRLHGHRFPERDYTAMLPYIQNLKRLSAELLAALREKGADKIFISHIQSHLQKEEEVVCKIRGKSANEITPKRKPLPEDSTCLDELIKKIEDETAEKCAGVAPF
jgi:hypothetical protein